MVEVLPNGLTLIVQDHRAADIVAVYLWVATGVRYESPDTLGHAHFQEHMLFKGTDTFGPGYIDRTVEGTGGRSNAFTTFDYTTFQVQVPSEATATGIQLLDEMAFRSKFDPKEIDAERQVIFEETRIETDNPRTASRAPDVRHGVRGPSLRQARARHAGHDERGDARRI